jgi:hypothetical protein
MQILQPFAFGPVGAGKNQYRIYGSVLFLSSDPAHTNIVMGGQIDGPSITVSPLSIQGATSMGPIRTCQLTLYADLFANASAGIFLVIDGTQVYSFPCFGATTTVAGQQISITAIVPVQANINSRFQFIASTVGPNAFNSVALYINLFDYEIPPYYASL